MLAAKLNFIDDRRLPTILTFPPSQLLAVEQGKILVADFFNSIIRLFYSQKFIITDIRMNGRGIEGIFKGEKNNYYFEILPSGIFAYQKTSLTKFLDVNNVRDRDYLVSGKIKNFTSEKYSLALKVAYYLGLKDWESAGIVLLNNMFEDEEPEIDSNYLNGAIAEQIALQESGTAKYNYWDVIFEQRKLIESDLKNNPIITLVIQCSRTGEIILTRSSLKNNIELTFEEAIKAANNIVIYNSPKSDYPFSCQTIKSVMSFGVRELRLITNKATYYLEAPDRDVTNNGWNRDYYYNKWLPYYINKQVECLKKYRRLFWEKKITAPEADRKFSQLALAMANSDFYLGYSRMPHRSLNTPSLLKFNKDSLDQKKNNNRLDFIDDRRLPINLAFPQSEAMAIEQGKNLVSDYFNSIVKQFYGSKFVITDLRINGSKIEGIFKGEKDFYKFEINPNGNYNYNETNQDKFDAKDCEVGKSCKNACIEKGKKCSGKIREFEGATFKAALKSVSLAQKGDFAVAGIALLTTALVLPKIGTAIKEELLNSMNPRIEAEIKQKNQQPKTISDRDLNNKIIDIEKDLVNNEFETLVVVNPKNGEILVDQRGTGKQVKIPVADSIKTAGAIVTHNHPKEDYPLSNPDIESIMTFQGGEIRAASPLATYSLKPPEAGWNRKYYKEEWLPLYAENEVNALIKYRAEVWKGNIDRKQADIEFRQLAVEQTARQLKVPYSRQLKKGSKRPRKGQIYPYTKFDSANVKCSSACECEPCQQKKKLTKITEQQDSNSILKANGRKGLKLFDDTNFINLLLTKSDRLLISRAKKLFAANYSTIIGQFYNGTILLRDVQANEKKITGIFSSKGQYYQFEIFPSGNFVYNETNLRKLDARECSIGKGCGDTCIAKGKKCNGIISGFSRSDFNSLSDATNAAKQGDWLSVGITLIAATALSRQMMIGSRDRLDPQDFSSKIALNKYQKIAIAGTAVGGAIAVNEIARRSKRNNQEFVTHRQGDSESQWREILEAESRQSINEIRRKPQTITDIALKFNVEREENKIIYESNENLVLIDPKNGETVSRYEGNRSTIVLPYRELKNLGGTIQTHNHPEDITFSQSDIETAMTSQAHELRAVTPEARYSLQPPKTGWNRQYFENVWQESYKELYTNNLKKYRQQWFNDKITQQEMLRLTREDTVKSLAKNLGLKYQRTEHNIRQKSNNNAVKFRRDSSVPQLITDRTSIKLVSNIISRSDLDLLRIQRMTVNNGKISGQLWARNGQFYNFDLDVDGKLNYRRRKTQRG